MEHLRMVKMAIFVLCVFYIDKKIEKKKRKEKCFTFAEILKTGLPLHLCHFSSPSQGPDHMHPHFILEPTSRRDVASSLAREETEARRLEVVRLCLKTIRL